MARYGVVVFFPFVCVCVFQFCGQMARCRKLPAGFRRSMAKRGVFRLGYFRFVLVFFRSGEHAELPLGGKGRVGVAGRTALNGR